MLVFLYRGPALSHILRIHGNNPFQLALGSPFNLICNAAISPPAALWRYREKIYLLFFNGFVYHKIQKSICQDFFQIILYGGGKIQKKEHESRGDGDRGARGDRGLTPVSLWPDGDAAVYMLHF
jgi:hypothetical protein